MYTISKIYVTTKELINYKLMMRCVMTTKACESIVSIAEKNNLSAAAASLALPRTGGALYSARPSPNSIAAIRIFILI